jgi:hypothetical protein
VTPRPKRPTPRDIFDSCRELPTGILKQQFNLTDCEVLQAYLLPRLFYRLIFLCMRQESADLGTTRLDLTAANTHRDPGLIEVSASKDDMYLILSLTASPPANSFQDPGLMHMAGLNPIITVSLPTNTHLGPEINAPVSLKERRYLPQIITYSRNKTGTNRQKQTARRSRPSYYRTR